MVLSLSDTNVVNDPMSNQTQLGYFRTTVKLTSTAPTYSTAGTVIGSAPVVSTYWKADYYYPDTGNEDHRWWKLYIEMPLYFVDMPSTTVYGIQFYDANNARVAYGTLSSPVSVSSGQTLKIPTAGLLVPIRPTGALDSYDNADNWPEAFFGPKYWNLVEQCLNGGAVSAGNPISVALSTEAWPSPEGTVCSEPSGGSYARQSLTPSINYYGNVTRSTTTLTWTNMPACTVYGIQLISVQGELLAYYNFAHCYDNSGFAVSAGATVEVPPWTTLYDSSYGD